MRIVDRLGAKPIEIATRNIDVVLGTFFSNVVSYFIILATTTLVMFGAAIGMFVR